MFIRLPVFPPRTNFFSPIFLPSPLLFILFSFALQLVLQLLSPGPSFFRTVLSVRVILFPWLGNAIGKSGRSMINRGRRWRQDWRPVTRDFWRRRREEEEEENRGEFGSWFTRLQRFSLAGKRYWWLGAATYVPAIGSLQVRLGNSLVCAATIPFKWKLLLSWSLLRVYIYIYRLGYPRSPDEYPRSNLISSCLLNEHFTSTENLSSDWNASWNTFTREYKQD